MEVPLSKKKNLSIGLISDTHGLLRPEAVDALKGSDLIIHAGDIGRNSVLDSLQSIAPVVAVRGNMDTDPQTLQLPLSEEISLNNIVVFVAHEINRIHQKPIASSVRVIISGHSHRPSVKEHNGILYVNPGSAGPRRFSLPVSVARLVINGDSVEAQLIILETQK